MERADELEALRGVTWASIEKTPPDKRAPLVAQYRAILAELAEVAPAAAPAERNGLVDFQEALAKRQQSATAAARGASGGRNKR